MSKIFFSISGGVFSNLRKGLKKETHFCACFSGFSSSFFEIEAKIQKNEDKSPK